MTTFKTRGLILREYEAGESDKRIMALCKNHGRMMIYARGARKPGSKFLAASGQLTYGDFVIADGKNFQSLSQAEVIEGFYPIREDYDKLCYAQYILEICDKTIPERTPCDDILQLVLKTLQHISRSGDANRQFDTNKQCDTNKQFTISSKQAVHVFLFRFFLINGVAPEMDCCCICGKENNRPDQQKGTQSQLTLFSDEGMVCNEHISEKPCFPMSLAAQDTVRHILKSDINKAFLFIVNDTVLKELVLAALSCWRRHFSSIMLKTDKLIHQ